MPLVAWVAAMQSTSPPTVAGGPHAAGIFILVMVAAVLALVVTMFVRTSMRRSSRR